MHSSIIQTITLMGLAILPSVSAFHYRFYQGEDAGCTHDGSGQGYPALSQAPLSANVGDGCHNSLYGVNWDHLEIDAIVGGGGSGDYLITFCNQGCQGGSLSHQSLTHCFNAPPGCAIGSFLTISG